jgi:CheY-like chemotaxis protein
MKRSVILAVDGDPATHEAFASLLDARYELLAATDRSRALDIVRSRAVDLVLLELMVSGADGFVTLTELRQIRPQLGVVVVTALDSAQAALRAIRLGAADYVTKPLPDDFAERIQRAVGNARVAASLGAEGDGGGILLLTGDLGMRSSLAVALRSRCPVTVATTWSDATRRFAGRPPPSLVMVDLAQSNHDAIATLENVRVAFPGRARVVLLPRQGVTPRQADDGTIEVSLSWPFDVDRLLRVVTGLLSLPGFSQLSADVVRYASRTYQDSSVAAAAADIGASPDHLSRVFRSETGFAVKAYLMMVCAEVAHHLLLTTHEKADTIAEQVGLCGASHLSRVLRRYQGKTVRVIREEGREGDVFRPARSDRARGPSTI